MTHTQSGEAKPFRSAFQALGYWVELALITVFGPAELDDENDPVVLLRRGHREHHPNMHWAG